MTLDANMKLLLDIERGSSALHPLVGHPFVSNEITANSVWKVINEIKSNDVT